jgi:hypothetical protein
MLSGCAGYRLGSNLPPDIRSIAVPVFVNETGQPLLETMTTSAAIQEFQKDGSLRILPRDQADSVIEVKLTKYALSPLRYRHDQTTTAQEYRLTITADVKFVKLGDRKILSQTKVEGYADFAALADLPGEQRAALPKASEDLAHRIVKVVVEAW